MSSGAARLPKPLVNEYNNRWLVLVVVSIGVFLISIDMTVLYTALPRLTHDLAAGNSQKLWIVNAFPPVAAFTTTDVTSKSRCPKPTKPARRQLG
jgi:hypothetical protein